MGKIIRWSSVAALAGLLVAPGALAETCPDARLASVIERDQVVSKGDAGQLQAALQAAERDLKDCAEDPHVMMLVAQQFMTVSDRVSDPGAKLYTAALSYEALHNMSRVNTSESRSVTVGASVGKVDLKNEYLYRTQALKRVFELERNANSLSKVSAPDPVARIPFKCTSGLAGDAQTAQMVQRDLETIQPGIFNFLDNVVEVCRGEKGDLLIRALSERAKAVLAVVDKTKDPSLKWTLVQALAADESELRRLVPAGGGAWWPDMYPGIVRDRIAGMAVEQEIDMPFERWFEPAYVANMTTEVKIGMDLDAAYAVDMAVPTGQQKRYEAYRAILDTCRAAIAMLPAAEQPAARAMVLRAVDYHREGKYRRKANASLNPPVTALSQWLRV